MQSTVPEISFVEGDVPVPPNVRPVIVLQGSDYDLGYQYYQQLVQIFGKWILERARTHPLSSEEKKLRDANEGHIKEHAPEMIDMMRGMAEGATAAGVPLSYDEVVWHFTREQKERIRIFPTGCSGFAAWGSATKDGRLICSGSTDHELAFEITFAVFPEKGYRFFLSPFWPTDFGELGGHPGMNDKGLAYVHHGATHWIKSKPENTWTDGLGEGIAIIHTLRFAKDANEAQKMQLSYPSGNGFAGGFWADVQGNAWVIESREDPRGIRKAGDYGETDFLYSTNNAICKELGHCQNPPPEGNTYIPHGGWLGTGATISSVSRNVELWNMLHRYPGQVDLNFAKMIWRFCGSPPAFRTLEEADLDYYRTQGEGWNAQVCELFNSLVGVMIPDDGDKGLYYVSSGCASRVAHPLFARGHHYHVSPTHSFYQLKLGSSPSNLVETTREKARYDLYYSNQELRKLNYSDVAYVPLDALFNQATTEWHKGNYHRDLALGAQGDKNETIYRWGKALRSYTRCQAYARQVYNALVPPAAKPEDLGLRPWG
jgi:hypothetical protein